MVGSAACFQECSDWDCGDRCLDEGISFLCCLNWVVLESPGLENLELQVKSQVFHVLKSNTVNFCLKLTYVYHVSFTKRQLHTYCYDYCNDHQRYEMICVLYY